MGRCTEPGHQAGRESPASADDCPTCLYCATCRMVLPRWPDRRMIVGRTRGERPLPPVRGTLLWPSNGFPGWRSGRPAPWHLAPFHPLPPQEPRMPDEASQRERGQA